MAGIVATIAWFTAGCVLVACCVACVALVAFIVALVVEYWRDIIDG